MVEMHERIAGAVGLIIGALPPEDRAGVTAALRAEFNILDGATRSEMDATIQRTVFELFQTDSGAEQLAVFLRHRGYTVTAPKQSAPCAKPRKAVTR